MLAIHAQPGAKRTGIAGIHGDALKVRVKAPPIEGRANEMLIEYLAKRFEVSKRDVALVSGETSREKRFEVTGSNVDPVSLLTDGEARRG